MEETSISCRIPTAQASSIGQPSASFRIPTALRATAAAGSMRDGNLQNSYCSSIFARPRRQARCATASVDGGGVTTSMRRRRDGLDATAARWPRWAAARQPRCDGGATVSMGDGGATVSMGDGSATASMRRWHGADSRHGRPDTAEGREESLFLFARSYPR